MTEYKCPDCEVLMEEGYVPDAGHYQMISQSAWAGGKPSRSWLFPHLINPPSKTIPITTLRCPECGLLREYALPK